jgi:MoaA/NifB/PqqE/SkfB family radical SAM enzyme
VTPCDREIGSNGDNAEYDEPSRHLLSERLMHFDAISLPNELSFLWLEITGKCNLFCSHCYADSGPSRNLYGNMNFEDWSRVLDQAQDLGCRSVQFIGGEPTMHPRLADLVDHANHRGFEFIEVYTNATRLDKELVSCFQRGRVHVGTAFYSDDPAVHERVTQKDGSWQRTVGGIRMVLDAGLPIRVGVVETDRNRGHGPAAVAFLEAMGVRNVRLERERRIGRGGLLQIGGPLERFEELCGQCWKGKLCVHSSGDAFPCPLSRLTNLGNVASGLAASLHSAKLGEFRRKVRTMVAHKVATRTGPLLAAGTDDDCIPNDCIPTDCIPTDCIPTDCIPTDCIPTDCIPTSCIPTG